MNELRILYLKSLAIENFCKTGIKEVIKHKKFYDPVNEALITGPFLYRIGLCTGCPISCHHLQLKSTLKGKT